MSLELRPFAPADWTTLLDLANAAVPFAPAENEEWLAYRRAFDGWRCHYTAVRDGQTVGYGCLEQQGEDPATLRIYVVAAPADLDGPTGAALYDQLLADAGARGATHLWARELADDAPIARFFTARGFRETERFTLAGRPSMVVYRLALGEGG